jgi:hypothetical protein
MIRYLYMDSIDLRARLREGELLITGGEETRCILCCPFCLALEKTVS